MALLCRTWTWCIWRACCRRSRPYAWWCGKCFKCKIESFQVQRNTSIEQIVSGFLNMIMMRATHRSRNCPNTFAVSRYICLAQTFSETRACPHCRRHSYTRAKLPAYNQLDRVRVPCGFVVCMLYKVRPRGEMLCEILRKPHTQQIRRQ